MQLELRDYIFSKSREQGLITKEGIVLIVYSMYMENILSMHIAMHTRLNFRLKPVLHFNTLLTKILVKLFQAEIISTTLYASPVWNPLPLVRHTHF